VGNSELSAWLPGVTIAWPLQGEVVYLTSSIYLAALVLFFWFTCELVEEPGAIIFFRGLAIGK
jgi:hypothetical protein